MKLRQRRARSAFLALLLALGLSGAFAPAIADVIPPEEVKEEPADPPEEAKASEAPMDTATPKVLKADPDFPPKPLPTFDGGSVVVIPIHGDIDLGLSPFVERGLEEAAGATLVVLDVDTFGGRVDAAVKIRDALLAADVPTLAYVNRRAISAGALISLAADHLVFAPGGSMGAATPIQIQGGEATPVDEKMTSYMRGEMRASAEASGRNPALAEAMVDASIAVDGVIGSEKLLTLTTEEAIQTGLADGRADTLSALLDTLGLGDAPVQEIESNWAEELARFLTNPVVSGLLMSLGMLGLFVELKSPGLGLPGAVGVLAMAAFFGGHLVANLAGWEEVLVFSLGLGLLIAEIFVIPGFGVAGFLGILFLSLSLVAAMFDSPVDVAWSTGRITDLLGQVMISFTVAFVGLALLAKYLPKSRFSSGLILKTVVGDSAQGTASVMGDSSYHSAPAGLGALVGQQGVAETDLRMSGKARIGGKLVDVVSESEYLDRGTPIRVLAVEGIRVVVVRAPAEATAEPEATPA